MSIFDDSRGRGQSMAELYERWLVGPLFQPWAELVLDRARVTPGDRVLDIACGTGIVARLARQRLGGNGTVVGVDLSRDMLAVAARIEPAIEWREGNAAELPIRPGEQFDVVLCHEGLQFFPDKGAALGQMRQGIAPGGRLVIAVWRALDEAPFFRDLGRVAERHLGAFVDRRHSFGDPAALETLIANAGFGDVRVERCSLTIRFPDPQPLVELNSRAVVGMSPSSTSWSNEERARIASAIAAESGDVVRQYRGANGLTFEIGANVATALAG